MHSINPSIRYPAWAILDVSVLLSNLQNINLESKLLDVSNPFINICWNQIYDELTQLGIKGFFSNTPEPELKTNKDTIKIMGLGYNKNQLGYTVNNLIPVISTTEDIYILSNLAQEYDKQVKFLVNINTVDEQFLYGKCGILEILKQTKNMPMIEPIGAYFNKLIDTIELRQLSFKMLSPYLEQKPIFIGHTNNKIDTVQTISIIGTEILGLKIMQIITCAITVGAWVYPISSSENNINAITYLGLKDGINSNSIFSIHGKKIKPTDITSAVSAITLPYTENFSSPFKAILCGGDTINSISPYEDNQATLQTMLNNWSYPIYIRNINGNTEYLPSNSKIIYQQKY